MVVQNPLIFRTCFRLYRWHWERLPLDSYDKTPCYQHSKVGCFSVVEFFDLPNLSHESWPPKNKLNLSMNLQKYQGFHEPKIKTMVLSNRSVLKLQPLVWGGVQPGVFTNEHWEWKINSSGTGQKFCMIFPGPGILPFWEISSKIHGPNRDGDMDSWDPGGGFSVNRWQLLFEVWPNSWQPFKEFLALIFFY